MSGSLGCSRLAQSEVMRKAAGRGEHPQCGYRCSAVPARPAAAAPAACARPAPEAKGIVMAAVLRAGCEHLLDEKPMDRAPRSAPTPAPARRKPRAAPLPPLLPPTVPSSGPALHRPGGLACRRLCRPASPHRSAMSGWCATTGGTAPSPSRRCLSRCSSTVASAPAWSITTSVVPSLVSCASVSLSIC